MAQNLLARLGSDVGTGLGQGLSQGLEQLTQHKLNQIRASNLTQMLQKLNVPPQEANLIPHLSPKAQEEYFSNVFARGGFEQSQQAAPMDQMLNMLSQQQQAQPQGQQPQISAADLLTQQQSINPLIEQALSKSKIGQKIAASNNQKAQSPLAQLKPAQPVSPLAKPTQAQLQKMSATDRKEAFELEKLARKEQHEEIKHSTNWLDEIKKNEKGVKGANIRLKRMTKLINEGSLPVAAFYNGIQSLSRGDIGSNIPLIGGIVSAVEKAIGQVGRAVQTGVTARDTEEFEKLSADFAKDAKQFFGSRLTDADLKAFMATVPTLTQTDSGKLQVIRNLEQFNKLIEDQANAANKIIKANGGKIPANLRQLVEDATSGEIDAVAQGIINAPLNKYNFF